MSRADDRSLSTARWNLYRDIADRQQLEREYSPSSCVPDFPRVVQLYPKRSESVRSAHPPRTLSYGASADERVDVWVPSAPRPCALLAYIHGGYWQAHSKNDHAFPAPQLLRHGIGYAAINYGIAPGVTLAEMIDRCRQAVRCLLSHANKLGFAPERLFLAGSSAGAHLAAMVALAEAASSEPGQPRGLILVSGVYDLRPITLTYINDALGLTLQEAMHLSPLLLLDTATVAFPTTLVVVGENETREFHRQTQEFATSLSRKGHACTPHVINGRDHFDLVFDLGNERSEFGRRVLDLVSGNEP